MVRSAFIGHSYFNSERVGIIKIMRDELKLGHLSDLHQDALRELVELLHIDLRPGQTCHSKVMHRKEVTHSNGQ